MAVIVLSGADFSQKNIKHIDLVFSDATKAILTRMGVTEDTSNNKQKALNTFVNTLTDANLLGTKIKSLCLPFLSELGHNGDLSYAQKNVLNGNNFFTANISGSLELNGHGLRAKAGASIANADFLTYATDSNFHVAGYNVNIDTLADANMSCVFAKFGGLRGVCLAQNYSTGVQHSSVYASTKLYGTKTPTKQLTLGGINSDGTAFLSADGAFVSGAITTDTSFVNMNPHFAQYGGSTYSDDSVTTSVLYRTRESFGLLSIGTSLTESEATIFNNATKTLMDVVLA